MTCLSNRSCGGVALSILMFLSSIALSAPYFDRPFDFVQPDGSVAKLILNGDEFYMRAETPDGFAAVRDPQTGWLCYAELSTDGSELLSTGVAVESDPQAFTPSKSQTKKLPNGKTIKKKLGINADSRLKKVKQNQKLLFGDDFEVIQGLAYPTEQAASAVAIDETTAITPQSAQAAPGTLPPTKDINRFSGTIKGLVLIFDFSDAPASYTLQQYRDKVNKINAHYSNGNASSLRTYYEDVSRGVFLMDHFVYGIFRAPQTFAYYDSLGYTEGAHQLLSYGLNDMEANGFDFSQLTTFSSGEIRALALMYTGNPAAWAEGMWYHAGGWGGFSADGVHTGRYCTDTANDLNPGTLIHEHGHMAAEWPDTYSYIGGEPGTWDIMGGGYSDLPNPYFLYENGWLDAENIMDIPGLRTMNSSDPHFAYFYYDPAQPTEFFVIRPYVTSLLYCPSIPDQGLTFWRINTQGDNANYPNTDRHIELVHANNTDTNKTSNVCFKEGGLLDYFSSFTTPSSDWKFGVKIGQPSGLEVTDISAAGAQMTFILGTPPEPVPYYPLNGNGTDASDAGLNASGYNFAVSPWSTDVFKDSYFDLNQSLRLDGIDDYVACPASAAASDDLTIAFWIKPDRMADMIPLDKFPTGSSGAGWSVRLTQDGRVAFLVGSQSAYTQVATVVPVYEANRWAHIACTYADGSATIYINGVLRMVKHGITRSVNTTALNIQMGIASQVDSGQIYQGLMDDVRFYDVALQSAPLNAMDGLNRKPDKGIVSYLKLDETAGTTADDASGYANDGTLHNGLSFNTASVTGAVGKALNLDGTDDYISLPAGMAKRNGGFTVALWACPTAVKNWARFIDFGNGPSSHNILLTRYQSTNDLTMEVYNGSTSGGYVRATGAIALNQWQFFVASVDTSGSVKIYKNGQLIKTGVTAAPLEVYRRNLYIGRSNWSADSYYQGGMDDVRIYNYPLSDQEVLDIYQNKRMDAPVPFSGDDAVSPEAILSFTPAANALEHDFYFGTQYNAVLTANPQSPEYVGRKQYTKYNPPLMDAWREYFWRIDERMPDGSTRTGPVWRFSTTGCIQRQVWTNLSGVNELSGLTGSANYPNNPSLETELELFEIPTNWGDNYGSRVQGLLVPQTTGSYRFWISGDNEVELWLSSTAEPANLIRIAYIYGTWSNPLSFDQHASQQSALYTLQAGQSYCIRALHKEGNGGDHMAVAWQGPDSPTRQVIDSFWLRPPLQGEWPRPYTGLPLAIPGKIQAEYFDIGYEGISYHDTTVGNTGGQLRTAEDVDIITSVDSGGGHVVSEIAAGEWLSYTVNIAQDGPYSLYIRAATLNGDVPVTVKLNNTEIAAAVLTSTGAWNNFSTFVLPSVSLTAATAQELRLEFPSGGLNLNWVEFVQQGPWGGQARAIPGRIKAEEFDVGGEGSSYHDTTIGNAGNAFRTNEDVDISAVTGGYCVSHIEDGEWLRYAVDAIACVTDLHARIASATDGGQIRVLLDGQLLGTLDVPNTGSLTAWQTVTLNDVVVPEGLNQVLQIEMVGGGFQLQWIDFKDRQPYLGAPFAIPGSIDFINYDIGGQYISYYDTNLGNSYGQYRSDDVEIMTVPAGGWCVYMSAGEWIEYTCDIQPGFYTITVYSAGSATVNNFGLSVDAAPAATFNLASTGGWFNWRATSVSDVYLTGGQEQIVRFEMPGAATLKKVEFVRQYNSADINGDTIVNGGDFAILAAQWLTIPGTPSADIAQPTDNSVDTNDLLWMIENWLLVQ